MTNEEKDDFAGMTATALYSALALGAIGTEYGQDAKENKDLSDNVNIMYNIAMEHLGEERATKILQEVQERLKKSGISVELISLNSSHE